MANFMLSVFGSTRNVTTALRDEYRVLCDKNQEDITCNHASDRRHLKSITKALITQRYIATFLILQVNPVKTSQGIPTVTKKIEIPLRKKVVRAKGSN